MAPELPNTQINPSTNAPWFDYPFADDGLDLWKAIVGYFSDYLRVYYKSDADVAADTELQGWWDELKVGDYRLSVLGDIHAPLERGTLPFPASPLQHQEAS
jgi:hypothetical protein